jgi:hypothetical protein
MRKVYISDLYSLYVWMDKKERQRRESKSRTTLKATLGIYNKLERKSTANQKLSLLREAA